MGHRVFKGEETAKKLLEGAQKAADQLCNMFVDGRLIRIRRGQQLGSNEGMLEDYVFAIQGLLALYQEDFNQRWFDTALQLQQAQDECFTGLGKRYSLSPLHNSPLPPRQDYLDGDLPSAQSTAITNLLTLNALNISDGEAAGAMLQQAERLLLAVGDTVMKSPLSHASY